MQLSLWDRLSSGPELDLRHVQRMHLGDGAWLEYAPDSLRGHHDVLQLLVATADWEVHRREMYDRIVEVPRLVAGVPGGSGFAFRQGEVKRLPSSAAADKKKYAQDLLAQWARRLGARYGRELTQISLGYYRNGQDSVAFHGDKLGPLRADTVVAILSVGERRKFLLRPAPGTRSPMRRSLTFRVGAGDLLVMGGSCQQTWEHGVPKAQSAGARIAIMFRESVPGVVSAGPQLSRPRSGGRAPARRDGAGSTLRAGSGAR